MNVNQYVQIRFETAGKSRSLALTLHDLRIRIPNYLRDDMFHNQFENSYFEFDHNVIKDKIQESYQDYNKLYKEQHGRSLRPGKNSDFLAGVITLSPIVNEWLEEEKITKEQLDQCFVDSMPKVQEKIKDIIGEELPLFYYVIHYDEKTPHLHFSFANHTKDSRAVFNTLKNSGRLSEFQDTVGDVFKAINLQRGVRKSKAKHMSVVLMHQEEIKCLKADIQTIKQNKKDIQSDVETTKTQKKALLDELDGVIKSKRTLLKEIKADVERRISKSQELESKIKQDTQKIVDSAKSKEELKETTEDVLKQYSNFNTIFIREHMVDSLSELNDEYKQRIEYLDKKLEEKIILNQEQIQKIQKEAEELLEQLTKDSFNIDELTESSFKYKKGFLGGKKEFDHGFFIKGFKRRDIFRNKLFARQNNMIKVLVNILRATAGFYSDSFEYKSKEEQSRYKQGIKRDITNIEEQLKEFYNNKIYECKTISVTQLNVSKDSMITKKDSKHHGKHQINLKININSEDKDQRILQLRRALLKDQDIQNISFSPQGDGYYMNLIVEDRGKYLEVLERLEGLEYDKLSQDKTYYDQMNVDDTNNVNKQR